MNQKDIDNIKASVKSGEQQLDKLNLEIESQLNKIKKMNGLPLQRSNDFQSDRNKMIKFAKENNKDAVLKFATKLRAKWQ